MEIKEKIVDELKIHIDTFEKYDNKITKDIENREKRYQERKKNLMKNGMETFFQQIFQLKTKKSND